MHVRTGGDQHKEAQEDNGSSVVHKSIRFFLPQRVQHTDNPWVGHRELCSSPAAVRNRQPAPPTWGTACARATRAGAAPPAPCPAPGC